MYKKWQTNFIPAYLFKNKKTASLYNLPKNFLVKIFIYQTIGELQRSIGNHNSWRVGNVFFFFLSIDHSVRVAKRICCFDTQYRPLRKNFSGAERRSSGLKIDAQRVNAKTLRSSTKSTGGFKKYTRIRKETTFGPYLSII